MFQVQLINAVVTWEWQQKMEEEKRKSLKSELDKTFAVATQSHQKERRPILVRLFKFGRARHARDSQLVYSSGTYEQCAETKPG